MLLFFLSLACLLVFPWVTATDPQSTNSEFSILFEKMALCHKCLIFSPSGDFLVSRPCSVPLWKADSREQVLPLVSVRLEASLFWRRLAPLFESFLRKSRRTAFPVSRSLFGATATLLLGPKDNDEEEEMDDEDSNHDHEQLAAVACKALPPHLRPCEWSVFVGAMVISTPAPDQRTSFVLLSALELETMQTRKPDLFGISRRGVPTEEVFTPSQCFGEIWAMKEWLTDNVSVDTNQPDSVTLVLLVDELRRIRCFDFEKCRSPADPLILQYLHIIILAAGLPGLAVLDRMHRRLKSRDEILHFYENFHWVMRSQRFQAYFRLPVPTGVVLTPALDSWVRSLQRKIDDGVNASKFDRRFAYDGAVEGSKCNLSLKDLLAKLGSDALVFGRAAVVHSYLQGEKRKSMFFFFFFFFFFERWFGDAI